VNNKEESHNKDITGYIPLALGQLVLGACLSQYPLALASINVIGSVANEMVSLRNEKQIKSLLSKLSDKIDLLSNEQNTIRNKLKANVAYQEVAHKRLLAISALDDERDLELASSLIAICGLLKGTDSRDKYLLSAVGDITTTELKLLLLGHTKRQEFETEKQNNEYAAKDAQVEREILDKYSISFYKKGCQLIGLEDFSHLISKLHNIGLTEDQSKSGFSTYDKTKKVYPPQLTSVGSYLIELLKTVNVS